MTAVNELTECVNESQMVCLTKKKVQNTIGYVINAHQKELKMHVLKKLDLTLSLLIFPGKDFARILQDLQKALRYNSLNIHAQINFLQIFQKEVFRCHRKNALP